MCFFADCFPKAPEAVNAKTTDRNSGELNGYQMRSLMQNNCAVLSQSINLSKPVSIVFHFYWLSFYRSVKFHYRKIRVTCCVRDRHDKSL